MIPSFVSSFEVSNPRSISCLKILSRKPYTFVETGASFRFYPIFFCFSLFHRRNYIYIFFFLSNIGYVRPETQFQTLRSDNTRDSRSRKMEDKIFSRGATINRFVKTCTILENAVHSKRRRTNRSEGASKKPTGWKVARVKKKNVPPLFSFLSSVFLLLLRSILSLDFDRNFATRQANEKISKANKLIGPIYTSRNLAK